MEGSSPSEPSEEVSKPAPLVNINEALSRQSEERGEPETQSQNTPLTILIGSNEILPIREIVQKIVPRILSLVVTDIKTRRLKKEDFEELLRKVGVPCQYFCRRNFATWHVLQLSKEQAAKAAVINITTKFFLLQPEYMDTRRI